LGYGAGFFDTFLVKHRDAQKIGVAFPFQLVEKVPCEPHDIPMDQVIYPV
jgi:5-formyltetrahydrofolate cyclo-ligase